MNIMFTIPAAVASSIVACRSFVSLTQFRGKDLYVHSAAASNMNGGSATRVGGDAPVRGRPGAKGGNALANIAFRGMGIVAGGVDSMGNTLDDYGCVVYSSPQLA
jgi:hypothetical protein